MLASVALAALSETALWESLTHLSILNAEVAAKQAFRELRMDILATAEYAA